MRKCLHIVYATDERYLLPTRVSLSSAVFHSSRKRDLVIDVLDCGISDEKWKEFENGIKSTVGQEFSLIRHQIDYSAYDKYKAWHSSRGIYARLDIPNILPQDVVWCVYADGDTLFVADPFLLEEVFSEEYALMGHIDTPGSKQAEWFPRNGFVWQPAEYICAGFLLINMRWFRDENMTKKIFDFLDLYPDVPLNEQDALNILCKGKIGVLRSGWGVFATDAFNSSLCTIPLCIHYVGERPWEWPAMGFLGLPDTTRLWFLYARKVCGIRHRKLRYFVRYIYSRIMKAVFALLCRFPRFRYRYLAASRRFSTRNNWHKLTAILDRN